jgi:hypothetical protein
MGWDMIPQSATQASFRGISSTTADWNSDAMAAMAVDLELAEATVPDSFNGRMITWLQLRLESTNTDLNGLLAEWHAAETDGVFDPWAPE